MLLALRNRLVLKWEKTFLSKIIEDDFQQTVTPVTIWNTETREHFFKRFYSLVASLKKKTNALKVFL